jgi:hypothetical protein
MFWLVLSLACIPPAALFTALAIFFVNAMDYFEDRSKGRPHERD